ncbi:hypothetical protein IE81DRAFT_367455 [Ceraceosorus guamensis]|uniref:Uncharacterized protein n=1 Tax=Ceraceosorus guamensis TaxID=1522189 RepID=A0A316VV80_9BASI|nr:hypothetical protein IE81DRAFT_367455 [Ceraceosorus guamensis]PWN41389.1 hypothetical protein IE81DRAFT_367455 [Ceraceosorus guamensis]
MHTRSEARTVKPRPAPITVAHDRIQQPLRHGSTSSVASTSCSSGVSCPDQYELDLSATGLTSSSFDEGGAYGRSPRSSRPAKLHWASTEGLSTLPTSPLSWATTPLSATSFGGYATPYDDGEVQEHLADAEEPSCSSRRSSSSMSRTVTELDKFMQRERRPSIASIASSVDSTTRYNDSLLRKAGRRLGLKSSQSSLAPAFGSLEGSPRAQDNGRTPSASRPASSGGKKAMKAFKSTAERPSDRHRSEAIVKTASTQPSPVIAHGLPSPMSASQQDEPTSSTAADHYAQRKWLTRRSVQPKSKRPMTADSNSSRSPRSPFFPFGATCSHLSSSSPKSTSIADVVKRLSPPPVGLPVLDFAERVELVCRAAESSAALDASPGGACKDCRPGSRARRANESRALSKEKLEQRFVAIELQAQKEMWLLLANRGACKDVIESLHLPRVFLEARHRLGIDPSASQFGVFTSSSPLRPRFMESGLVVASSSDLPPQPQTAHPSSVDPKAFSAARHGPSTPNGTISLTPAPRKRRPRTAPEPEPELEEVRERELRTEHKITPERLAALPKVKLTKDQLALLRSRAPSTTSTLPLHLTSASQHRGGAATTSRSTHDPAAAFKSRSQHNSSPKVSALGVLTPANFSRQIIRAPPSDLSLGGANPARVSAELAGHSDAESSVHSNSSDSLRHVTAPRRNHRAGHDDQPADLVSSPSMKSSLRESVETARTEETAGSTHDFISPGGMIHAPTLHNALALDHKHSMASS